MNKKKLLYLTNLPAPYKIDFFNLLSKEFDLTVVAERRSADDRDPKWIKDKECRFVLLYLSGIKYGNSSIISFGIIKYLKSDYDLVIVNGYASPTMIIAINYLSSKKIPFFFVSDGMIPKKSATFKEKYKSKLLKKATLCLSSGKMNTDALLLSGVNPAKIRVYPFSSISENEIVSGVPDKDYYKRIIGCENKTVFLYVGQMIYRKGVDLLVKAFNRIQNDNIELICVGGGKTYFDAINDNRIKYVEFLDKDNLKDYYLAADMFILPTREDIWGLVVNEAFAHGCPVITTDMCAAGIEMIDNRVNGYIVPNNSIEALYEIMSRCVEKKNVLSLSIECVNTAHKYTIEKMAERTTEIINEFLN